MFDVILFTCISDNAIHTQTPALGAYKCAQAVREHGYSCLVINHIHTYSAAELTQLLDMAIGPNTILVGTSTTFMDGIVANRPSTQQPGVRVAKQSDHMLPPSMGYERMLMSHIKRRNSSIKIMVGGARVHKYWKNEYTDFAIIGYAECAVVNLANHIRNGEQLYKSSKNHHGVTIIDDRLAPGYNIVDSNMKWLDTDVVNHTKLPIEIGRGCIFKCAFCAYPLNGKKKLDFIKSASTVVDEIKYNYEKYGIYQYSIVDDTFNDSVDKLIELHSLISKLSFQPEFWCYARLDLICTHPETLALLYGIGIRSIFFGIETLDSKSGRSIGKGFARNKQIAMIQHIKKTYPDLKMHGNFIVGTPYESVESVTQTAFDLVDGKIPLDTYQFQPLYINRNSDAVPFASAITVDYTLFGYKNTEPTSTAGFIEWDNGIMTFRRAIDMANRFNSHQHVGLNGTHGGNEFITESTPRSEFITSYKKTMFDLVKSKKDYITNLVHLCLTHNITYPLLPPT